MKQSEISLVETFANYFTRFLMNKFAWALNTDRPSVFFDNNKLETKLKTLFPFRAVSDVFLVAEN